jgi:hypothetical protein
MRRNINRVQAHAAYKHLSPIRKASSYNQTSIGCISRLSIPRTGVERFSSVLDGGGGMLPTSLAWSWRCCGSAGATCCRYLYVGVAQCASAWNTYTIQVLLGASSSSFAGTPRPRNVIPDTYLPLTNTAMKSSVASIALWLVLAAAQSYPECMYSPGP